MTTTADLIRRISRHLKAHPHLSTLSKTSIDNIYEAYLFSLLIRAAKREGGKVTYACLGNTPPRQLCFRQSPGSIKSLNPAFTHAEVKFDGKPLLEVHVGVKTLGTSKVAHECDVMMLSRRDANKCRASKAHPRSANLIFSIECKFYTSTIPLHEGRSFLGFNFDSNVKHGTFFVSNTASPSVEKLLSHFRNKCDVHTKLTPVNSDEETMIVSVMRSEIRKWKTKS